LLHPDPSRDELDGIEPTGQARIVSPRKITPGYFLSWSFAWGENLMKKLRSALLICLFSLAPAGLGEPTKIDDSPLDAQFSLSFDELVTLSATDELAPELAAKLDRILQTPTVHNYISAGNSHPKQPTANKIGPILRVGFWNIERGLQFDLIKQALVDPEKFEETVDSGKKRTASQRARIVQQAEVLRDADIVILNEVDLGMKRTDYRDVARELAETLGMNYVYGVEFVEVDGLEDLGTERSHLENRELASQMDADLKPDPALYRGFHGNAMGWVWICRGGEPHSLPNL
jgi:hypothetical protein